MCTNPGFGNFKNEVARLLVYVPPYLNRTPLKKLKIFQKLQEICFLFSLIKITSSIMEVHRDQQVLQI